MDLLLGIPLALAALPIVAIATAWILVTSGWPPLIRQARVGVNDHTIRVLKLRTMRRGVPVVAKALLLSEPGLYIPGGKFMRRWSLDELPQLANVLIGDMSIVGPRPALPTQLDLLALRRRHGVTHLKPGLTGMAQVFGRESLTLTTKVRLEALYAHRRSLGLDVFILLRTGKALVSGRGAF